MPDTTFQDYVTPIPASWLNDVNGHTYNSTPIAPATTVHPASVIANTPAGTIAATNVQDAINELDTEKATTGSVTTVQTNLTTHINNTTAAHAASAIANTPAGTVAATTVQAAINELDTEKAPLAGSISQSFSVLNLEVGHTSDTTVTRSAAGVLAVEGVDILTTATVGKRVAQIVTTQTGTVATGTTLIPADNTIPQSTEGDQYMSLAITPTNVSSTLEIDVTIVLTSSVANNLIAALFQDTTANALSVAWKNEATAGATNTITMKHVMAAGTTSATTFKVRAGGNAAGTTTFNGAGGVQYYGGVLASRITIKEYLP